MRMSHRTAPTLPRATKLSVRSGATRTTAGSTSKGPTTSTSTLARCCGQSRSTACTWKRAARGPATRPPPTLSVAPPVSEPSRTVKSAPRPDPPTGCNCTPAPVAMRTRAGSTPKAAHCTCTWASRPASTGAGPVSTAGASEAASPGTVASPGIASTDASAVASTGPRSVTAGRSTRPASVGAGGSASPPQPTSASPRSATGPGRRGRRVMGGGRAGPGWAGRG